MDRVFEDILSKKADDTSNGYYFYNAEYNSCANYQVYFDDFECAWNCRKLQDVFGITTDLEQIVGRIADENKPFLEVSCGTYMGLTPFILKRNSEIRCLVADIDDTKINGWRKFIDDPINDLFKYHISLARFDNCDMPIIDDSFDYVTSTLALNYIYNDNNKNIEMFYKALKEIHRVLKRGGCYVAIEHTRKVKFDMAVIHQECQPTGSLHGIYSYDEMKQVHKEFQEERLKLDHFLLPGFDREVIVEYEDERHSDKEAFLFIHNRAEGKSSAFDKSSRERSSKIKELKKSAPYLGLESSREKYFLVQRKL